MKKTREYYLKKFNDLMLHTYNYIPQAGEKIVQCHDEYPPYWFISNYGRLLTTYYNKTPLKQIAYGYSQSGQNYSQHDWFYVTEWGIDKHKYKEPRIHKLVAEHFLENEFVGFAEVEKEDVEVHHKIPERTFSVDEPFEANKSDNLQILPKSIHKKLTSLFSMGAASEQGFENKFAGREDVQEYQLTQEQAEGLLEAIQKHIDAGKLAILMEVDSNKAMARPLKK